MYKFYEIQGLIFLFPSPFPFGNHKCVFYASGSISVYIYKFICITRGLKRVGHDLATEQEQIIFFRFHI